mmetsp:Transcript_49233/g.147061  ORF Transcript_49233/g.147061 Transcript_49233/m.147061 type:complete len:522 (+) Transcript_49233:86-1651(+)
MAAMAAARRVLSVQSHVVHGYVGNRAAVFPLQLLGFEVDVINSVQFSCHTGYPAFPGQKLDGNDLHVLVQGLAANEVLNHAHLLTGYIGTASFLREVVRLRQMLPAASRYVCDPVMGDNGKLYVSRDLVDVYREEVLPHVTVLTPNQFEAELLTDRPIASLAEAAEACDVLHGMGPNTVVITTLDVPDATRDGESIAALLSQAGGRKWLLRVPFIAGGPFTGTGDLTAAMILAWTQLHPHEAPEALEKAGAVLQAVLRRTTSLDSARTIGDKRVPPELRIIDCQGAIKSPCVSVRSGLLEPLGLRGVVFDMDGTLTLPGQIDFARMRERVGVPTGDIVTALRERHAGDPAALAEAMAAIDEEERRAFDPPALQPGLKDCIQGLLDAGIRVGLATRNSPACVDVFLKHAGLPVGAISPIVTRDSGLPNKPDPAPVLHCCREWEVEPSAVLMVGDQLDDLTCGRAAGSLTAAMLWPGAIPGEDEADSARAEALAKRAEANAALAEAADFTLSSLEALKRLVGS